MHKCKGKWKTEEKNVLTYSMLTESELKAVCNSTISSLRLWTFRAPLRGVVKPKKDFVKALSLLVRSNSSLSFIATIDMISLVFQFFFFLFYSCLTVFNFNIFIFSFYFCLTLINFNFFNNFVLLKFCEFFFCYVLIAFGYFHYKKLNICLH